ncbi:MAG: tetratricopeptide repeat protein [Magnetococcales bacterium]|nr:tetratricopeptide repeat protein [Magnetococcales bacterium]
MRVKRWCMAVGCWSMILVAHAADPLALAQQEMEQGDFNRAVSLFGEVLRNPHLAAEGRLAALSGRCTARYQQHLANKSASQTNFAQQALTDCKHALEQQSDHALAYRQRGMVWLVLNNPRAALADLNVAVALEPKDFMAIHHRGVARSKLNQNEAAMEDFNNAIRLNPDYPAGYYYRGQLHTLQNRHDAATADFSTFFQLVQRDGHALSQAERQRMLSGRDLTATVDFNRVQQQQPSPKAAVSTTTSPPPRQERKKPASASTREEVTDPLSEVILDASLDPDLPVRAATPHRKGSYAFKIESFRESANADKALARVSEMRLPVYVEPVEINRVTHLRVWVGPFNKPGEAEAARRRLTTSGFSPDEVKQF